MAVQISLGIHPFSAATDSWRSEIPALALAESWEPHFWRLGPDIEYGATRGCLGSHHCRRQRALKLQLDRYACIMQFARFQVELSYAEVNKIGKRTRCLHGGSSENSVLRKERSSKNCTRKLANAPFP